MPRRHRRAPEPAPPAASRPNVDAPAWARAPGFDVRSVSGEKVYRCPGCEHEVRAGVRHVVVVPLGAPAERRHWHEVCWRQELRRTARR